MRWTPAAALEGMGLLVLVLAELAPPVLATVVLAAETGVELEPALVAGWAELVALEEEEEG